jgi:PilZ domain
LHEGIFKKGAHNVESAIERRRFKRAAVLRPVKYVSKKFGETTSLILELSCGGAYIESPVVPIGSEIEMEFNLMDGHTVRATALVRYIMLGAGMGVEFQVISEEDKTQIGKFVEGFHIPVTARVTDDLK